jgi:hypothetical protein
LAGSETVPDPTSPGGPPEDRRIGRDRVVAADRFEMRSRYLGQETCAGLVWFVVAGLRAGPLVLALPRSGAAGKIAA